MWTRTVGQFRCSFSSLSRRIDTSLQHTKLGAFTKPDTPRPSERVWGWGIVVVREDGFATPCTEDER